MLKSKLKKIIVIGLTILSCMAVNPICVHAEWREDNKGWWYSEGNSYVKNCWRQIDGNWYYFDYDGYISTNTIIDGYYVDSNGVLSDGTEEIQAYKKVLLNLDLLKNKYGIYDSKYKLEERDKPYDIKFYDMDGNGTYEAVARFGNCDANMRAVVFDYKDGQVRVVSTIATCVYFNKEQQIIVNWSIKHRIFRGIMYKYENGELINLHSFEENWMKSDLSPTCEIDDKVVSEVEFKNFIYKYLPKEEIE